jgi:hypothetical protein
MNRYWVCGVTRDGDYVRVGPFAKHDDAAVERSLLLERNDGGWLGIYAYVPSAQPSRGDDAPQSLGTAVLEVRADTSELDAEFDRFADKCERVAQALRS